MPNYFVTSRWVDEDGAHEIGDTITLPEPLEAEHEDAGIEHAKVGFLLHHNMVSTSKADVERAKKAAESGEPVLAHPLTPTEPVKKAHPRARAAKKK